MSGYLLEVFPICFSEVSHDEEGIYLDNVAKDVANTLWMDIEMESNNHDDEKPGSCYMRWLGDISDTSHSSAQLNQMGL